VANGGLFKNREVDEEGRLVGSREWLHVHDAKTEAVRELVEEMAGSPVLIAYDFEHDLDRLLAEFGKDSAVIGGGISATRSDHIVARWNDGKVPWLFGHTSAMAHGLNAQEGNAHHVIIHSPNPDFELYDQYIRRLLRSGNTSSHVFVYLVVAKDTVDEVTLELLRKKDTTQGALMRAMSDYSMRRRGVALKAGKAAAQEKARRSKAHASGA
jgi:SNF2 family DNA or RNA helicase